MKAAEQIGEHHDPSTIQKRLRSICPVQYVTVRMPEENVKLFDNNSCIKQWHRDGAGKPYAIVVWSNRESTEVKVDSTGEILLFPPGAIVLIRNHFAMHRMPPVVSPDRWFARAYDVRITKINRKECK